MKKKLLSYILIAAFLLSGVIINVSDTADAASGKWKQNGKKWSYSYSDGTSPKNKWEKIDGKWYHFDKSGYRQTGWQTLAGKTYYFNAQGVMQIGWRTYSGNKYYFNGQGVMQIGWRTYSGKKYYFNGQGVMQTGWRTINGKKYYFNGQGVMQTGWRTYSGKKYYFNAQGVMQTGWRTYSGKKYYFNSKGVMQTGWQTIGKNDYYFNTKGILQTGWQTIDGKTYYFNDKGIMQTGLQTIDGNKYYFGNWGRMETGLIFLYYDEAYYFNDKGVMQTGWQTIGGRKYYFNDQGLMQIGWLEYNGKYYYFNEVGVMQTGVSFTEWSKYLFDEDGVCLGELSDEFAEIPDAKVGDYVTFGSYEQDNIISDGTEPILWRVLAKEDEKLLLISEYALDCKKYNEMYEEVTWETCTLRKWLNNDFYNMAFSVSEKSQIQNTTLAYNTKDNVFLLSKDETTKYFNVTMDDYWEFGDSDDLSCKPTSYAVGKGLSTDAVAYHEYEEKYNGYCCWWLRSHDRQKDYSMLVNNYGYAFLSYNKVNGISELGIRPAIWITIE